MRYRAMRPGMVAALGMMAAVLAGTGTARAEESVFDQKSPSDPDSIIYGGRGFSDRSAVAGLCSLVVPGVGQAMNRNSTRKIVTHALVGALWFIGFAHPVGFFLGVFHIWSGWDGIIDRQGGYINGCVDAPASGELLDASTGVPVPVG